MRWIAVISLLTALLHVAKGDFDVPVPINGENDMKPKPPREISKARCDFVSLLFPTVKACLIITYDLHTLSDESCP